MMNKKAKTYFEIFMLILGIFASSYIFNERTPIIDEFIEKIKTPVLPSVSADTSAIPTGFSCCEETTSGAICQDIGFAEECASGFHQYSSCESTPSCQLGCCINDYEGTYSKNSPQMSCDETWVEDKNCNVPGSEVGCCVVGLRTFPLTQKACERKTETIGNLGNPVDWREDLNEIECLLVGQELEKGACLFQNNNCKFTTLEDCMALAGSSSNFYEGYLCTSPSLGTKCEKTEQTSCFEGKREVYFIDTCGNQANIYDSSKVDEISYWDSVTKSEDSCGWDSSNGNQRSKDCGNCDGILSTCSSALQEGFGPTYGAYYCKDTSCTFRGEDYKSGESWCVYDGKIGDGDDVVGSRHWRYVCNQGEVQVEPCADYRSEICVQTDTFDIDGEEVAFRNSYCRINNWQECIYLSTEEGDGSVCSETLDCMVKKINFGEQFHFDACVPKYPPGFAFEDRWQAGGSQVCGLATQTCTVIQAPKTWGGCKIVENEDCLEGRFTKEMNDLCRSLGDCGGEVNIVGKYSKNYGVVEAPELNANEIQRLVGLATPVPGQKAEVGDMTPYLLAAGIVRPDHAIEDEGISLNIAGKIGLGVGGVGFLAQSVGFGLAGGKAGIAAAGGIEGVSGAAYGLGAFGYAAMGAGIGMLAGSLLAQALDLPPGSAMLMSIGGGILGLIVGISSFKLGNLAICFDPITCVIAVVGIILMIIAWLFGGDDCDPIEVKFTCKTWQPPIGASDCDLCNNDPLKPCSDYRCGSLGAACELINKGTGHELCMEAKDNGGFPFLEPIVEVASPNVNYGSPTGRGFSLTNQQGGCLNAYETIVFGINTDEPSQCRFDMQEKEFEEMRFDLGANAYVYNHTTSFVLPDPSHGQSQGIDWNGLVNFHIKCRDRWGHETPNFYVVNMCVNEADDITAPRVTSTSPDNGGLVSFDATERNITIYTNELSECKWSNNDKEYEIMENTMSCEDSLTNAVAFGYKCEATIPITSTENEVHIRCKDQPWLEAIGEGDNRNVMTTGYEYVLRKPEKRLEIDSIKPVDGIDISVSSIPATVELEIRLSGGGDYNSCSHSFTGYELMIPIFTTTFESPHSLIWNQLPEGNHNVYVECEDEIGDKVRGETSFEIIHDETAPKIARIYQQGGSLKVITTEVSECAYSERSCSFDFIEGTNMGTGTDHSITVTSGRTYYIKCKDEFGNVPSKCSMIVKPGGGSVA